MKGRPRPGGLFNLQILYIKHIGELCEGREAWDTSARHRETLIGLSDLHELILRIPLIVQRTATLAPSASKSSVAFLAGTSLSLAYAD